MNTSTKKNTDPIRTFGPVSFLPGPNKGRYPYCHSILLEEAGVLIDPASDRQRLEEIKQRGIVKMVWLSHWHEDHIRHLDLFDDLPLWVGEHDAPPLADLETLLDWYAMEDGEFRDVFRKQMLTEFRFRPRIPQRLLKDGEIISLGNLTVEVIHIPGHTPGQLAFYFKEPNILFMADVDLTRFGPWYGDNHSDVDQTIASIEKLRRIPAKVWLTCHEQGVFEEDPGELWQQYLNVIYQREEKLLKVLASNPTMDEIIHSWITYGKRREPVGFYEFGERAIMGKHLQKLMASGTVGLTDGRYHLR